MRSVGQKSADGVREEALETLKLHLKCSRRI